MGILSDGRCPPERLRPTTTRGVDRLERTNGHAACGHDGEPEPAVVDLDDVDAFLPAAVQRALLNGPRLIGPQAAAGCVNAPVVHAEVLGDRGEDLAHASLLACLAAVAPRACRRPGSVGSSSRRAGAERSAQHGRVRAKVAAARLVDGRLLGQLGDGGVRHNQPKSLGRNGRDTACNRYLLSTWLWMRCSCCLQMTHYGREVHDLYHVLQSTAGR